MGHVHARHRRPDYDPRRQQRPCPAAAHRADPGDRAADRGAQARRDREGRGACRAPEGRRPARAGRFQRQQPRLEVCQLGDEGRAAARRDRPEGHRGRPLRRRPPRQRREDHRRARRARGAHPRAARDRAAGPVRQGQAQPRRAHLCRALAGRGQGAAGEKRRLHQDHVVRRPCLRARDEGQGRHVQPLHPV